jgi:predicted esterase
MRWLGLLTLLLLTGSVFGQSERYELAVRLKNFEKAWDEHTGTDSRDRALKNLPEVTTQFFSLQLGKAGKLLDDARFQLKSATLPSDDVRFATSLFPDVRTRLVEPGSSLSVTVKPFYDVGFKPSKPYTVKLQLGDGEAVTATPEKYPHKLEVPVPQAETLPQDVLLKYQVLDGKTVLIDRTMTITLGKDATKQAETWLAELKQLKLKPTLETASLKLRANLIKDFATDTVPESDVPLSKYWGEAKELLQAAKDGKPYFTSTRTGDQWINIPTGEGDTTTSTACRWWVPKGAKANTPLVIALHGAGGSENMFFEGYGDGQVVKLCEKRGWFLLSPRAGLGFGGNLPLADMIAVLKQRYPEIDTQKVFLLGHSMGAGMSIGLVQKYPTTFAAVAAMGGAGTVRKDTAKAFENLPTFIGVGDKDFALRSSKALNTTLVTAKATKLIYKEYPKLEHLVIVRQALPDVFEMFDGVK